MKRKRCFLNQIIQFNSLNTWTEPGIFVRGGGGSRSVWQKKARKKFFYVYFSPQHILQKSNGKFPNNLSFSRFQRGSNLFQGGGGVQPFPGGGGGGGPIAYSL